MKNENIQAEAKKDITGKVKTKQWKNPIYWAVLAVVLIIALSGWSILKPVNSGKNGSMAFVENTFGEQAKKIGAAKCAALFSNLGQTATQGAQFQAATSWDSKKPDERSLSATIGQIYGDNTTKGAGFVFTAPVENGCEGNMVRTVITQTSCSQLAQEQLPQGSKRMDDLGGVALFNLPNVGQVIMIPASQTSCVVVTSINLSDTGS
ncbi:hypothetical protein [Bartonella sp. LJL80]